MPPGRVRSFPYNASESDRIPCQYSVGLLSAALHGQLEDNAATGGQKHIASLNQHQRKGGSEKGSGGTGRVGRSGEASGRDTGRESVHGASFNGGPLRAVGAGRSRGRTP